MEIEEIRELTTPIFKRNAVRRAGLFGSVVTHKATPESDIDILVELPKGKSLLDFVRIKLELEEALRTRVDLVEYQTVKARLKDKISSEEVRIYG
jgi:uncharacterized protein